MLLENLYLRKEDILETDFYVSVSLKFSSFRGSIEAPLTVLIKIVLKMLRNPGKSVCGEIHSK